MLGDTDSPSGEVRRILEWGISCSRPLLWGEEEEEEREFEEERVGEEDEEGSANGGEMEEGSHPRTMPSSTSSPDSDSIDDFLLEEFAAAEAGTVGIRDGLVGNLLGAGIGFLEPITGRRLAELVFNCSATSLAGLHRFLMSGILLFFPPMFSLLTT